MSRATNSNEKTERNRKIFEERKRGAQVVELASKYGLSLATVHSIVVKEETKELKRQNADLAAQLGMLQSEEGQWYIWTRNLRF